MIKEHTLEPDLSQSLYDEHTDCVSIKNCYINIFNIAIENLYKFDFEGWKIAYGYMSSVDNLMVRHCFIVNRAGQAIDPTIFAIGNRNDETVARKIYASFKVFDDLDEYAKAIEDNKNIPDLLRPLMPLDISFESTWAKPKSKILIR
ncbi:hypothetical protein MKY96_33030 [Paenibacillus sp. FSL R7-0302]|uniref:hypothetical protein n=1 Tax=Paenibacillus sp. FSL R7-0302 TaxID=2921681 RepID=UPI0030FCEA66